MSPAVDISLQRAPSPEAAAVPVDQIMVAVESVRGYVVSHLARIGRASDIEDVMQDVRMAVWDGVMRGRYRKLPGVPFGAWVQGVCSNVCSAHIRRELSRATSPLLMDPVTGEGAVLLNGWARLAFYGDCATERFIDQEWARMVLALVRENVSNASVGPGGRQPRRATTLRSAVAQGQAPMACCIRCPSNRQDNHGSFGGCVRIHPGRGCTPGRSRTAFQHRCCVELRKTSFIRV